MALNSARLRANRYFSQAGKAQGLAPRRARLVLSSFHVAPAKALVEAEERIDRCAADGSEQVGVEAESTATWQLLG